MVGEELKSIIDDLANKLKNEFGYCAVADSENVIILNTDDGKGLDIKIVVSLTRNDE